MKLILERNNGIYNLYNYNLYGIETWGKNTQISIEKKRKYYYWHCWIGGNEYINDEITEIKLNIVLETNNIEDIIRYLKKVNYKNINDILEQYKIIIEEELDFIKYYILNNK